MQFPVSFFQSSPVGNVADRLSGNPCSSMIATTASAPLCRRRRRADLRGAVEPTILVVRYSDPTPFVAGHEIDPPRLTFDGAYSIRTQFFAEPHMRRTDRHRSARCPLSGTDSRASSPQNFKAGESFRERDREWAADRRQPCSASSSPPGSSGARRSRESARLDHRSVRQCHRERRQDHRALSQRCHA